MVTYIKSDLEFILAQIKIAEAHAAGQPLYGPGGLIPTYNLAWGLRTVDGTDNNLLHPTWGAADQQFPERLGTDFRPADGTLLDFDGPGPAPGMPTQANYNPSNNPGSFVVDSSLRTISNLIVDQTLGNPSAILTALQRAGIVAPEDQMAVTATISNAYAAVEPLFTALTAAQVASAAATAAAAANPDDPALAAAAADAQAAVVAAETALTDARTALDTLLETNGVELDGANVVITAVAPDEGLSAPFNSWFTLFGQFFDHGLDLINKGGSGTVFIPLQPDDPLYDPTSSTNFMVLTRATVLPGADGIMNTADDVRPVNTTTSFVDQNQTYTSHSSHQVFVREYVLNGAGDPVSTGKLIQGGNGGMATWADVKAQTASLLGIQLIDSDVGNIPLLATDQYGEFIRGPNGYPQMVFPGATPGAPPILVEGNPAANGGLGVLTEGAIRTGHAFLADIAHNAVPTGLADGDIEIGLGNPDNSPTTGQYDNELLDAHYVAGDGRANENIGLTAVHHVFHSEHNRLADHTKSVVLATNDLVFINEWLVDDIAALPTTPAQIAALVWDGERIFQTAKFGTEMQYQHLVFEEFARKIQPNINVFLVPDGYDVTIDPSIVAEFAHVVYRFGHSMLTESIDRFDPSFTEDHIGLIEGFLNPLQFENNGTNATVDAEISAGAIIRGMTRQAGNEIDEFVTSALRNNLLGLPLDLATINLARGRDTGVPSLNAARAEFYAATDENSLLKPYESWVDFAGHLKNEASIINFVAAYGTHSLITGQTTIAGKRDAALTLITGESVGGLAVQGDAVEFLNATGAYAGGSLGGLNNVDLWIGGLAEAIMPFGGMLGSTFNFVFETQMESLQNGDRFYYLQRLDGLHLFGEMEGNSFAAMIMRNTDATHLPSDVFSTPGLILEVDRTKQYNPDLGETAGVDGILLDDPTTVGVNEAADNMGNDPVGGGILTPLVSRNNPATAGPDTNYLRYTGGEHVVLGGTDAADVLIAGIGDDTLFGDGGADNLEGGFGNDIINGGDGDDVIRDAGGDDNIKGGAGNDAIHAGPGLDLVLGGAGQDFVILGTDMGSEVFGGEGDDFMLGNKNAERILGNEGNDWIETGTFDGAPGDNFDEIFAHDGIDGHDVFLGDGGFDEFIGEGGDDIFVGSPGRGKMAGMSGFDWATYKDNVGFVNADLSVGIVFDESPTLPQNAALDEFESVQGLSGTRFNDQLKGSNEDAATMLPLAQGGTTGYLGSGLDAQGIAMISGLQGVLGAGVNFFGAGDIILGGDGSDVIMGQGGDDIIDGDKWLDVQIGVFTPGDTAHTGTPIRLVNSMKELTAEVFAGLINPGQLSIVRTIKTDTTAGDIDTAVFQGLRSEYTFSATADGQVIVSHAIENQLDGTDKLRNIERVQFLDGGPLNIVVGTPYNDNGAAPQGAPPLNQPVLNGAAGEDLIIGLAGTDVLNGLGGNDILVGGPGSNTVSATDGFTNYTGGAGFTGNWTESNDTGGGNGGSGQGQIRIANNALVFGDSDGANGNNPDSAQIQRTVNLAGATSASISYTFTQAGFDAGETVTVLFSPNGSAPFQTIQTITNGTASGSHTATLNGPFTAGAVIRFEVAGGNANSAADLVAIDNLAINFVNPSLNAGVDTLNGGLGDDTYSFAIGDGNDTINEAVNAASGGSADRISIMAPNAIDPLTGLPVIDPATDLPIPTLTSLNAFDSNTGTQNGDLVINYGLPTGATTSVTQTITVAGHFTGATVQIGVERINFNGATYAGYQLGAEDYLISRADPGNRDNGGVNLTASIANNFIVGEQGVNDEITGGGGNDLIFGGTGDNDLVGGLGDDLLVGGSAGGDNDDLDSRLNAAGDDFEGAIGADTMIGGVGNDTYGVDDLLDIVVEAAGEGTDEIQTFLAALSIETVANVENLTYMGVDADQFVGTGNALNNVISGGDLADTLSGLAGNDTLQGGLGADTMTGGDGNDVYVVDEVGDVVVETSVLATDIDRVESDIDYTLGANLENLDLNNNAVTGRGNALNNLINGNGAANQLFGGAGNDTLNGDDGNDLLDGGVGNDTLNGGDDSDTIIGGDGNDTIDVGGGVNTIIYNAVNFGADIINSFDAAGGTPQTQDRIDLSAFGITAANFAARVTIAAAGANTLVTVRDAALASIGTIQVNGVTSPNITVTDFTLATAPAAAPINGTAAANTLNGTANADTINGLGGNDTLNGLASNDVLNGGEGADTLNGGDGNDTLTGGAGTAAVNNADNFDTASQGNSTGTTAWGPDWVESGDSGGVTTGQIRIDAGNNNVLQFIGGAGNDFNGAQIQRSVDLLGASGATLSYSFVPTALDAGADNDSVTVSFSRDGVTFVQVDVINSGTAAATRNIDLTLFGAGPFTSNAVVRFVASSLETGDSVNIDNLSINATGNFGIDTVNGDAGDDTVIWNANPAAPTDGRDVVNGGTEGAAGDTFVVNGNTSAETYNVYTRTAWLAVAGNLAANLNANTEIVVTRNGSNNAAVIAELNEIEEIRINGVDPAGATGTAGGDTFNIVGDFSATSLRLNTITIDGSGADDVVDITGLVSDHRVVFNSNGGADTIKGEKRAQDVVNVTEGGTLADNRVDASGHDDDEDDHGDSDDHDHGHDDDEAEEDAVLSGGSGDDRLSGGSAGDTINGGSGDDHLKGRSGNDTLNGGSGDDVLAGGSDDDRLNGGSGDDELHGGSGDDILDGGSGDDVFTGGSGADIFRFGASDSITDFEAGDRIDLRSEGVSTANFASKVALIQHGDDAWLKIGSSKMLISDVDVDDLDLTDFILSDGAVAQAEEASLARAMMPDIVLETANSDGPANGGGDLNRAVNAYECRELLDATYYG